MYKLAVETGQVTEFEDRYHADGVDDWFRATVTPIPDGIAIATQIITERKKAEEELKESEARFRSVLDNSLDAVYRVNLKTGRYEYTSPAFEDVFGFSPEELMSQTPEQAMSLIHPDDIPW